MDAAERFMAVKEIEEGYGEYPSSNSDQPRQEADCDPDDCQRYQRRCSHRGSCSILLSEAPASALRPASAPPAAYAPRSPAAARRTTPRARTANSASSPCATAPPRRPPAGPPRSSAGAPPAAPTSST